METLCYTGTPFKMYATLYHSTTLKNRGVLLYFHGGGLIYGHREDLPQGHLECLLGEGFSVLAFDYRLSPVTKIEFILKDVLAGIGYYLENAAKLFGEALPYFLWGRSAGAYLCLLAACQRLTQPPKGILSYYGYGLLADKWYEIPSPYYKNFPRLSNAEIVALMGQQEITEAPLEKRYGLYVHARQTGRWITLIHGGSRRALLKDYSLGNTNALEHFPPVLLAHSTKDPDVPFVESELLASRLPKVERFTVTLPTHDFDRQSHSPETIRLLKKTVAFMEACLEEK